MKTILLNFLSFIPISMFAQSHKKEIQLLSNVDADRNTVATLYSSKEIDTTQSYNFLNWDSIMIEGTAKLNPQHVNRLGQEYAIELASQGAYADANANALVILHTLSKSKKVPHTILLDEIKIISGEVASKALGNPQLFAKDWCKVIVVVYPHEFKINEIIYDEKDEDFADNKTDSPSEKNEEPTLKVTELNTDKKSVLSKAKKSRKKHR